jgi:UDP-GlcNAc3NAcA epimerase
LKIVSVVGARPQFIKAAVVSRAIRAAGVHEVLVHTGQHYDDNMSKVFFDELQIPTPDYHLGVGAGSHGIQTGGMLEAIERVLQEEDPERVLVYGDTNSTLAGALAAAKLGLPVAHVEAGLRSFNRRMPEEINRVLTDHVSSLLFAPTATAVRNLQNEGIVEGVHEVGDVMYDAVLKHQKRARSRSKVLQTIGMQPKRYALATVHRSENTDQPERLRDIFTALETLAREIPVVLPLHPRTRKALELFGIVPARNLLLIEPAPYLDMLLLESEAKVILTDSGGVQKEAFFFHVPCVTLRDETEWIETVQTGWNTTVGTQVEAILAAARKPVSSNATSFPFGTGVAAQTVCDILIRASAPMQFRRSRTVEVP